MFGISSVQLIVGLLWMREQRSPCLGAGGGGRVGAASAERPSLASGRKRGDTEARARLRYRASGWPRAMRWDGVGCMGGRCGSTRRQAPILKKNGQFTRSFSVPKMLARCSAWAADASDRGGRRRGRRCCALRRRAVRRGATAAAASRRRCGARRGWGGGGRSRAVRTIFTDATRTEAPGPRHQQRSRYDSLTRSSFVQISAPCQYHGTGGILTDTHIEFALRPGR